jgi:GNAT superfamily N-acetyltransferase
MTQQITIREAITEQDTAFFYAQLHAYHERDIFPDPEDVSRAYFLDSTQYGAQIQKLHDRARDPCHYLLFSRNGRDIGFALAVLFRSEDGKCFLMEFCVLPEFRGGGTGLACAQVFLAWARENGAAYAELNCNTEQRKRFWQRSGFRCNGTDEWGEPLMLLPPSEPMPFTVDMLTDGTDWQLRKLESGYLSEIGEALQTEDAQARLSQAVTAGKITFFFAMRGCRAVGMCSVAPVFSTFSCADVGIFEDFYVEPVFRRQGIARMLTAEAAEWCSAHGISSLSVTCAPCDAAMYQALGFRASLGSTYTRIIQ